jgi:hypothetical protein
MTQRGQAGLRSRSFRAATAIALGLPLLVTSTTVAPAAAQAPTQAPAQLQNGPASFQDGRYIVMLQEHPLASYEGGTEGFAPTKPVKGQKIAINSNARAYEARLKQKQKSVAASVKAEVRASFTTALNGFTAVLTAEQAAQLAKTPGVYAVAPDERRSPDYSSTEFLGLTGESGVWETQLGGVENAGKGTVVGVIDTGYRPRTRS